MLIRMHLSTYRIECKNMDRKLIEEITPQINN
jgi:hypothetical protein